MLRKMNGKDTTKIPLPSFDGKKPNQKINHRGHQFQSQIDAPLVVVMNRKMVPSLIIRDPPKEDGHGLSPRTVIRSKRNESLRDKR